MPELRLTVVGPPVPKGRPRLGRRGRVYTPKKTELYENLGRVQVMLAVNKFKWKIDTSALYSLTVSIFTANKKHGDLDNYIKSAADFLMPHAMKNDKQIVELHAYLVAGDKNPRCEVILRSL